jgi:hypothetical protein
VVAAAANVGLRQFELVERPTGQPLLAQAAVLSGPVGGWSLQPERSPAWAGSAGRDVDWARYRYLRAAGEPAAATSSVVLDLLTTPALGALSAHGLESVYPLHAHRLAASRQVQLGGGVIGHAVVYRARYTTGAWVAVSWDWPVRAGDGFAYERVVLSVGGASDAELTPPAPPAAAPAADLRGALVDVLGGGPAGSATPAEARTLDFLGGFGRRVVTASAEANP